MKQQQLPRKLEKSSSIEFNNILQKFGEFPSKYRPLIWKTLLQLPLNESVFIQLFKREVHPAYSNLEDAFPVSDSKLMDILKKILSCLAYWCPLFAEVTYLPLLVFPFVKALMDTPLICFETIVTYLVNWCQDWFQLYPAPPFSILGEIDIVLESMAPQLMAHFKIHQVSARIYAWALLESSFSDIFTKEEWFAIWDHVFTEHQDFNFLYAIAVAYSCVAQNALLRCSSLDDFQRYFHEKNPILVKSVLDKAKDISLKLKRKRILHNRPFLPLPQGIYPQFSNYPLAAVKNHAYQMQKIRKMEKDYLEQRKAVLQLEAEYGSLPQLQEKIRQKDAILQAADYLQMQEVMYEDQRLCNQRLRLQVLKKEMESKELTILDAKKLQLIQDHQLRQESRIKRMADTAHWMSVMRHDELHDAADDIESTGFQHQANMSRLEIDLLEKETDTNKRSTSKNNTTHNVLQTGSIKQSDGSQQPVNVTSQFPRQKADVHHSSKLLEERLEEQLKRVEDNNKNMEAEIKDMIDTLHVGLFI